MTTRTCRLCRCPIEGRLEFIEPSIVCVKCGIRNFRSDATQTGCFYTVSESEAIDKSECLPSDLECLQHLSLWISSESEAKKERRYLRGEVWFLRNLRRKETVEAALGLRLEDIHPLVRHFLLGDYMTALTHSETSLEDVLVYKDVIHQATELFMQCPWAHPKATLDFCVLYPNASPQQFQEMKQKMRLVFHLEGRRILHGLVRNERQRLKYGPLADVLEAFCSEESRDIIRGYLMQWFSHTSVDAIMADEGWKEFKWATGPEDRVAYDLMKFWKEKHRRKEKLLNALKKKGLMMPPSSILCDDYMNGVDDLTLKEVVAAVDLAGKLSKLNYQEGGCKWIAGFQKIFQCLRELKLGHFQSVKRAVDAAMRAVENEEESETDDDDEDEED